MVGGGKGSCIDLQTSSPVNVPLILGGVKTNYIGQDRLMPQLATLQQGELAFIVRENARIPVIVESVTKKSFRDVAPQEWINSGQDGIESYITRLGGNAGDARTATRDALDNATAVVVKFHVANAAEITRAGFDPIKLANNLRAARVELQNKVPTAESQAEDFAYRKASMVTSTFQEAAGKAIADMRGKTQSQGWSGQIG